MKLGSFAMQEGNLILGELVLRAARKAARQAQLGNLRGKYHDLA